MSSALARLLAGQIAALSNPLISEVSLPNGMRLYQVAGTSGAYSVTPRLPAASVASSAPSSQDTPTPLLGYCPCPAFSYAVFKQDNQVICKHLLALHIALHLATSHPASRALVKKEMGLKWIAAFATGFAPAPAQAQIQPPARGQG